jgi:Amino acid kinase family
MRIVIALGGNALLRRGEPMTTEVQRRNVVIAAEAIAPLAAEHSIVVVHGNGPQVGLLSLQAESYPGAEPYPLDVRLPGSSRGPPARASSRTVRPRRPDPVPERRDEKEAQRTWTSAKRPRHCRRMRLTRSS